MERLSFKEAMQEAMLDKSSLELRSSVNEHKEKKAAIAPFAKSWFGNIL